MWWGVDAFLNARAARETEAVRAERLAGLSYQQHPGKGRYYVPAWAVIAKTPAGTPVAYLHYGAGATEDNNIDDFLRTYDLPPAGTRAPLPEDLRAVLPGDRPTEGVLLPEGRAGRQVFVVLLPGAGAPRGADVYVRAGTG
ncbi:hypothetical protein [Streptomyces sp. NRRL WC-3742]|uniref:hypothetical protein n=1 Tax=Streptomyces sp. NRRL WC-3742 TaxID=1463934 RepID=UPI00131B39B8|nr:hypothetical protein [Streptomyces sp. NRRL WC-3742]